MGNTKQGDTRFAVGRASKVLRLGGLVWKKGKRICSVIDDLPLDFKVSQQSEAGESGLSQGLESHHLSDQTSHDAASLDEADSQSSHVSSRDVTPDTSLSQRMEGGEFKKPRKRGRPVELHQIWGCCMV